MPRFDTNGQLSCLWSAVFLSSTRAVSRTTRISSSVTELFPPLPELHSVNNMEQYLQCAKDRQYYIYDMQLPSPSWLNVTLCWAQTRAVWPAGRTFIKCGSNWWLIDKFLCYLLPLFKVHFFRRLVESVCEWQMLKGTRKRSLPVLIYYSDMLVEDLRKVIKMSGLPSPSRVLKLNLPPKNKWVFQREVLYVISLHW